MSDSRGPLLPLTAAQSGVWYAQQLNPQNTIFNTGEFLEINGPVDAELFEAALRRVVTEAETLRLRFLDAEGGPAARLVPAEDLDWSLHVVDVSAAPNPRAAARAWMAEDFATPWTPSTTSSSSSPSSKSPKTATCGCTATTTCWSTASPSTWSPGAPPPCTPRWSPANPSRTAPSPR